MLPTGQLGALAAASRAERIQEERLEAARGHAFVVGMAGNGVRWSPPSITPSPQIQTRKAPGQERGGGAHAKAVCVPPQGQASCSILRDRVTPTTAKRRSIPTSSGAGARVIPVPDIARPCAPRACATLLLWMSPRHRSTGNGPERWEVRP
eukprot:5870103-Prymnesium_polylepis.1